MSPSRALSVSRGRVTTDGAMSTTTVSKQLDELWQQKKASSSAFRDANNAYCASATLLFVPVALSNRLADALLVSTDQKLNEDRAKRDERRKAERKEFEDSKRAEVNERLLEEAQAPAFERDIEDCQTLIRFFQQRIGLPPSSFNGNGTGAGGASSGLGLGRNKVAGVPELEPRKVEQADFPKGAVALKKKSEQEEESWGGLASKSKKGRKAGRTNAAAAEGDEAASDDKLNLPFGTLSGLMALGIPAPLTTGEVQKTIDSLQLKKKYFTDNQVRPTA